MTGFYLKKMSGRYCAMMRGDALMCRFSGLWRM